MITQKKIIITCLLLLVNLLPFTGASYGGDFLDTRVTRVIDGDTFVITGGSHVRLLGINAPERGEVLSTTATERLKKLTVLHEVNLEVCEERDIYGRFLATVRIGDVNINNVLLREGLALPMLIPPCGSNVALEVLKAAVKGIRSGKGIYSPERFRVISHSEAGDYIGKRAVVKGRVMNLHKGPKAWHLNFGKDWKTDFTAVIFRKGLKRFRELGLDPAVLDGSEVLVIGKLGSYNGPEIIVRGPDQILPLEDRVLENPRFRIQR